MTNEEAKEILEWELTSFKYTDNEFVEARKVAIKALEERPKGKWEYITHHARRYRVCPICKTEKEDDHVTGWNFCQYCGARME